jgi:diguanylate cyclase (GGDEF)-like protein
MVVDLKSLPSLKSFVLPGGALLLGTAVLLQTGLITLSPAAVDSYYAAAFGAGIVLAWRFHSTRVALTLATLFLAERALMFFSGGHSLTGIAARTAFALVAVLLPLNYLMFAFLEERGFSPPALGSRLALLFVQSVIVAAMCRPDRATESVWLKVRFVDQHWLPGAKLPQLALLAFVLAVVVLLARFVAYGKPIESGFLWSLLATTAALHFGGVGKVATAYLGTAALILLASVIETSYLMAYHDELTGVPARRAFNDALLALEPPYAIAMVDIDHFKKFNDTYGHETGDHVLRLVAARLARVSGGGKAFRCGGEEFSIIFAGVGVKEAARHLESLRDSIEHSTFRLRTLHDRRSTPRGPDRRRSATTKKQIRTRPAEEVGSEVTVTVSMGVAEAATRNEEASQVIRKADQALYRAKANGRNRIEISGKAKKNSVAVAQGH